MRDERRSHLANVAVICLLLLLARLHWMLSSVYHHAYSLGQVAGAMALLLLACAAALCLPLIGARLRWAERGSRALVLLLVLYIVQGLVRAGMHPPLSLNGWQKLISLATAVAIAALIAHRLSRNTWARLRVAATAAALIYALTPFALVPWLAPTVQMTLADIPRAASGSAQAVARPTLVLLLDELSAALGPQLVAALQAEGAVVRAADVKAVGLDTINVVPEMFGSAPLPAARVCTLTALCDRDRAFDFARVKFDTRDKVHLVGFYHPYCATQGWQSCVQVPIEGPGPLTSLACTFAGLLPRDDQWCEWVRPQRWQLLRRDLMQATLASPFWRDGGWMFAHLPFPHPPGDVAAGSLLDDYQANMGLTEDVVRALWRRLHERFGADFRLVISSDHPLRTKLWCLSEKYVALGCSVPVEFVNGRVPFIIAAPQPFDLRLPATNAALLMGR